MENWVRIADYVHEIPFQSNNIAEVRANGKTICIARHGEHLFAFVHKCPHAGGYFLNGFIDPLGKLVCPLHRYKFDMANGRNVSGEGFYLKRWEVVVREDGVFVNMI